MNADHFLRIVEGRIAEEFTGPNTTRIRRSSPPVRARRRANSRRPVDTEDPNPVLLRAGR